MKYKLIKEPNSKYFRIKALKDIPRYSVEKGDLGGLVETEGNLDHLSRLFPLSIWGCL